MESAKALLRRFEQLNEIGTSLSNEVNLDRLLENILLAAKAITLADGGTLYRMNDDKRSLRFEIVRSNSLGMAYGGVKGGAVSEKFQDLPLYWNGKPNNSMVAAYVALSGETVNIADAYRAEGFDFSGTKKVDELTGYRSKSFLTVPMKNHENEVIGVLQLINAIDPVTSEVKSFSIADKRLAESLASQAAVALTNRHLVSQLEDLFESFVSLINLAIDEKSPYTGGHCQRVPSLTMLLANAVIETHEGPLADFSMSEQDLYALKIAGLLHDCGKVTTPVHVVDKATKLQTIYDRIDLIQTRFEIIRRDFEIQMLRAISDGVDAVIAKKKFIEQQKELEADKAFLAYANKGSEQMSKEDSDRIFKISKKYKWRDTEGNEVDFLSEDELENLSVRSGTLTQSERQIINNHIVSSIKMLKALPWPKHLQNVTEYAAAHHERMDGKGYPNGLSRDGMSIPARIMGIADIFEALTARDRPYKAGMKLSEALKILRKMSQTGHVDPDLFDVFVKQKVYLKYAKENLDPAQIDEV